jgi:hypothetical protein
MSSELQRVAGKAPRLVPSREDRAHKTAVAKLVNETNLGGLRIDAEAALTARAMERATDVDHYRRSLAGDDPVLNQVLASLELAFCAKAERIIRTFGSDFVS